MGGVFERKNKTYCWVFLVGAIVVTVINALVTCSGVADGLLKAFVNVFGMCAVVNNITHAVLTGSRHAAFHHHYIFPFTQLGNNSCIFN